jgi:hypothetical protein
MKDREAEFEDRLHKFYDHWFQLLMRRLARATERAFVLDRDPFSGSTGFSRDRCTAD